MPSKSKNGSLLILSVSIPVGIVDQVKKRISQNERSLLVKRLLEMYLNGEAVVKVFDSNGQLKKVL